MFLILEEAKKNFFGLFTRNCECVASKLKYNNKSNLHLICKIMTRYNSVNVKLSNSQLNKLKSAIKN